MGEPHADVAAIPVGGDTQCRCVKWHRPKVRIIDVHHIQPLSWDGPDTPDNKVTICPNTHRLVHELLDRYKRRSGILFADDVRPFPRFVRELAWQGWTRYLASQEG